MSDQDAEQEPGEAGPTVHAAIARLIGGDPLAIDLLRSAMRAHRDDAEIHAALAAVVEDPEAALSLAQERAITRRERQFVAIVAEHRLGDHGRCRLLARQHLAEFPDDVLISWLSSRG